MHMNKEARCRDQASERRVKLGSDQSVSICYGTFNQKCRAAAQAKGSLRMM